MSENKNETTLGNILGINNLPEAEREAFLKKMGSVIIDASVSRLLVTLEEDKVKDLENYLNTISDDEDVFAYLLRKYPDFQSIVEKEIAELKGEMNEIFVK